MAIQSAVRAKNTLLSRMLFTGTLVLLLSTSSIAGGAQDRNCHGRSAGYMPNDIVFDRSEPIDIDVMVHCGLDCDYESQNETANEIHSIIEDKFQREGLVVSEYGSVELYISLDMCRADRQSSNEAQELWRVDMWTTLFRTMCVVRERSRLPSEKDCQRAVLYHSGQSEVVAGEEIEDKIKLFARFAGSRFVADVVRGRPGD